LAHKRHELCIHHDGCQIGQLLEKYTLTWTALLHCGQPVYIYMLEYIHQNIMLACIFLYAGTIMSKSYISCYTCMVEHISQGN